MDVIWISARDWEPLVIRFIAREGIAGRRILSLIERWKNNRRVQDDGRSNVEAFLLKASNEESVIGLEFMNKELVQSMAEEIAKSKIVCRMEIGYQIVIPIRSEGASVAREDFVHVVSKNVWFESGSAASVAAFDIARTPVSVSQFREFATSTGYRTAAEREGSQETYLENQVVCSMSPSELLEAPALRVSWDDAVAYCRWLGVRLPSEDEWLAAHVLEWEKYEECMTSEERSWVLRHPNAIETPLPTWTSLLDETGDHALARYGPFFTLRSDWRSRKCRLWHKKYYCGAYLGIRVCKVDAGPGKGVGAERHEVNP